MRHSLPRSFLFALTLIGLPLTSKADVGDWTPHRAYHTATDVCAAGDRLYALFDGNLMAYTPSTGEVELLDKTTGLSGTQADLMAYCADEGLLLVMYSDGNIDLIRDNGEVDNLPQVKNAAESYSFLRISVVGSEAYVAEEEGVLHLDLGRGEIVGYYDLGETVYAASATGNYVYAALANGIVRSATGSNHNDPALWEECSSLRARRMVASGENLYLSCIDPSATYLIEANDAGEEDFTLVYSDYFSLTAVAEGQALLSNETKTLVFPEDAPTDYTLYAYTASKNALAPDNSGSFWAASDTSGVQQLTATADSLTASSVSFGGYGPRRDYCYYMAYTDAGRLLVGGGSLSLIYYGGGNRAATAMYYENGSWGYFQETGINAQTGSYYENVTCIAEDPGDPAHHYVATAGAGLFEFDNFAYSAYFNYDNSPLQTIIAGDKNYVRIDGLSYDKEGNLWMVNNQVDTTLRYLRPDGTWGGVYIEELDEAPTLEKTLIDSDGRLWVCSRRTVTNHDGGLLGLDFNNTADDTSDDRHVYRSTLTNSQGSTTTLSGVYAIAEDNDGQIWIGTAEGVFVIPTPADWFASSYVATQPLVPRNDGTNYGDYLLDGVAVTAIAVDGANRKWLGTDGHGLYLVNADGTEVLESFTTDNSPLPSDVIYALAANPSTGELMIGTDAGMISYMSEATTPATALDKTNIKIYPNPVRPEYTGNVRVSGLTDGAEVKIVTVGGQTIAYGTSAGGTFVWNVKDHRGHRPATGVYYVMICTADGEEAVVGKVVVI